MRARLPARQLLTISHSFLENVLRAPPDVQVMELALRPSSASEDVAWRESCCVIRHMVMQEHSVLDGYGPENRIRDIWPMDS